MAKKLKRGYTPKSKERAKSWNYRKIMFYFIALLFIIAIIWLIPQLNRVQEVAEIERPSEEPRFRKDSELSFFDQDRNLITTIDIEIADDNLTRMQGLMFRQTMAEDRGMLFIFDQPHPIEMWMRNTYIPLDMIFVREDRTIAHIAKNTVPFTDDAIQSPETVLFVIEVNASFTDSHGIRPGYIIDWY